MSGIDINKLLNPFAPQPTKFGPQDLLVPAMEEEQTEVSPLIQELAKQQAPVVSTPNYADNVSPRVRKEMSRVEEIEQEAKDLENQLFDSEMQQEQISPPSRLRAYQDLLSQAQKGRRDNLLTANLLMGGNQIAQGFATQSGAKIGAGEQAVQALRDQAGMPVQELNEDLKNQQNLMELQAAEEQIDPNSPLAKQQAEIVKQLAEQAGIQLPETGPMSAKAQVDQMRSLSWILGNKLRAQEMQANREMSGQNLLLRLREAQEARAEKFKREDETKLNKKVETISNRLEKSGALERNNAIKDIEGYLTDKYNVNLDSPTKDLKKVDVEGIGLLGNLRPDFLTSSQDVSFRQNVAKLANTLLKARSGAAVTDQEYARFLREVGSGNFSNEIDLLNGLKKMKQDIVTQNKNIGKTYGDDVLQEYETRTGNKLLTEGEEVNKDSQVGPSGLTPEQRRKRIEELKAKQGK
jgi:hypothetical protein